MNVELRRALDLYVNLRPAKTYPGVPRPIHDVDLVLVRENTEDLYMGLEFERGSTAVADLSALAERHAGRTFPLDAGVSLKPISVSGTRRVVRFALEHARSHDRRHVTVGHKANIMKYTDGLFLEVAREEARGYPDVAFDDVIVDNLCLQLVQRPQQYDVLVLPNLYGDIISDLCAGLVGGLGVAPGANLGDGIAVFEPVHGSAPDIAGQGVANPIGQIWSGAMMLDHLGEKTAAAAIVAAIERTLAERTLRTRDLGGNADTIACGKAVAEMVE